jgi:FlaA1/EpsC-like NDP-sugar epimerase
VFVLDMGEPVRITELARHMVSLSGMSVRDEENSAGDIEICYVGLRPGEKLYEELFLGDDLAATRHPRIRMSKERVIALDGLEKMLFDLKDALDSGNRALVRSRLAEFIAEERNGEDVKLDVARISAADA